MSLSTEAGGRPHSHNPGVAYNLAGLALLVLLLAVGFAYLIDQAGRSTGPAEPALGDTQPVLQTIGGRELSIPTSWFRYGEQMKDGFASQADLRFNLSLAPDAPPTPVEVTLLPRSRARASSELLDRVYLHQFGAGIREGYPGLVGKPMMAREGYDGETVWYDALSPNPFVAKCAIEVEPDRPDSCLRTIHLQSGIAAVLKFDATALVNWRRFNDELALWLGQIGAL
ncbi:hypothetical protein [Devosia rhizoryzae]|uniref:Uncharacterized protein n=1 Tax=Devosia rhizoryzae TaxID=2774137 RepID=A0ABX7CEL0_9HYPH|nr:hypothetical protein [Devosia rhizoryzae]QQR40361.1 hypothetical protein JI748_04970 [Devosia rhizoryzae]